MFPECVQMVEEARQRSSLIRAVRQVQADGGVRFAIGGEPLVTLSDAQVRTLEAAGNIAEDWSSIRVVEGFDPSRVRRCSFHGRVVLGRFDSRVSVDESLLLPAGLYDSTLSDCVIGANAVVRNVRWLHRHVIGPGAVVWDVGALSAEKETQFGIGQELPLGIESGGREVGVYAEITVDVAARVTRSRGKRDLLAAYSEAVQQYAKAATCGRGIVEAGAVIRHTGRVIGTYVGPAARIENATAVLSSALLSSPEEPVQVGDGAYVEQSILQWGSEVNTGAIVQRSVLVEHSHVERHGKVSDSLIGPNTGIAEGEVTASLVGPFVGFHHQALLIAALWPEGKGNVSYGANVGSNHTAKAPDQEIWPGEGTFFGLGVNIRFPSDFTRAPYSIFATGINTLPQKIGFPFSLINSPAASFPPATTSPNSRGKEEKEIGISPAYNEIIPAWLLTDNVYALQRNEGKYKARNKARRSQFEFDVFRSEIVDLMLDARQRLLIPSESPGAKCPIKEIYTEQDIPGLGKNYLLEPNRQRAIDAYSFYIAYYALGKLKQNVQHLLGEPGTSVPGMHPAADAAGSLTNSLARRLADLLDQPSDDPRWEHARQVILQERERCNPWVAGAKRNVPRSKPGHGLTAVAPATPADEGLTDMLRRLADMQEEVAQAVEDSKRKDDDRGRRIIDDYAEAHIPAEADKFVRQIWQETAALRKEIESLIQKLTAG